MCLWSVKRRYCLPSPAGFTLESTTPAQLDAEARRKKLREDLQARQDKPLIGTQGDIGQMDMLGGNDLFSAPAAKVSKAESGELRAESPKPIPASAELRIGDFGEKIGGARKDNAVKGEMERSAWAMVDTDTENSGAAAADMLQWQHDPALRAPGSRIDEMLTRLEGEWQKTLEQWRRIEAFKRAACPIHTIPEAGAKPWYSPARLSN